MKTLEKLNAEYFALVSKLNSNKCNTKTSRARFAKDNAQVLVLLRRIRMAEKAVYA